MARMEAAGAVVLGKRNDKHAEGRQLRREGLGRGHADLRTGPRQHHQVRLPDQRTLRRIANRKCREIAQLLTQADRRQRVGRLARLRNGHQQRVLAHYRLAVAIFAGDFDPAGQAADLFDEILRDHTGMKARAAGHNMHRLGLFKDFGGCRPEGRFQQAAIGNPLLQRVGHGARLLVDLLEHEVAVRPLLNRIG